MPNFDDVANYMTLEGASGNSAANGVILVAQTDTICFGNSTVNSSINSTSLSFGSANTSNALAGYITLSNGVKMNYGGANANSTGTVITFGLPYTTNVFSVGADSNTVASTIGVTTANTTKITLLSNTTTNVFVFWQAWGI